ncbi:MAG: phage head closure protein [Elusimicrobiales bacterium]|nr:phage head closure protein [Elusimicrobiales bacterium]
MNPGLLRHSVTVQARAAGVDTSGAPNGAWIDALGGAVWAAIWPLRGKELYAAQQAMSQVETRIRIRYRSDITPQMRVAWQGRIFEILYVVDPELRHVTLDLMCREIHEGAS